MLNLSREYGRERLAVWAEEIRSLKESWDDFSQEWQGSFADMTALAMNKFGEISAAGRGRGRPHEPELGSDPDRPLRPRWTTGGSISSRPCRRWPRPGWGVSGGGSGGGSAAVGPDLLGEVLDFGGLFHQGGMVTAHQGMVVAPETLLGDEQLILAQTGEGILPRDSHVPAGGGKLRGPAHAGRLS